MTLRSQGRLFIVAAAAVVALFPVRPMADVSLSMIEYRVLAQLGQVRLTTGSVHDPDVQKAMLADLQGFDRRGLILVAGEKARTVSRHETVGTHTVDTTISIEPAVGRGYRGGLATATLVVSIDGTKRIDCPYDAGPIELDDVGIAPAEGLISISGSYDDRHVRNTAVLSATQTIDRAWLQRNAK